MTWTSIFVHFDSTVASGKLIVEGVPRVASFAVQDATNASQRLVVKVACSVSLVDTVGNCSPKTATYCDAQDSSNTVWCLATSYHLREPLSSEALEEDVLKSGDLLAQNLANTSRTFIKVDVNSSLVHVAVPSAAPSCTNEMDQRAVTSTAWATTWTRSTCQVLTTMMHLQGVRS